MRKRVRRYSKRFAKAVMLLALFFALPAVAQESSEGEKPPVWHAAGWCTLNDSADGGWCDAGVGVSILSWRWERIDRYVAIVGALGEGETVALGFAVVISLDPVLAVAFGGSARYSAHGIDLSSAQPSLGMTLSF